MEVKLRSIFVQASDTGNRAQKRSRPNTACNVAMAQRKELVELHVDGDENQNTTAHAHSEDRHCEAFSIRKDLKIQMRECIVNPFYLQ